jgi:putative aldouronate transport system permease protein
MRTGSAAKLRVNAPPLWFRILNAIILTILLLIMAVPMWNTLVISFTSNMESFEAELKMWPREPSVEGYVMLLTRVELWRPFLNNVVVTAVGVLLYVICNSLAGFVLARVRFPGKGLVALLFLLPMMIPSEAIIIPRYITMQRLGLIDTLWAVILSGVADTFAIYLMRNYFTSIPRSLEESAHMDGASQVRILTRIYLPLSTAGLATITLMEMVGKWNHFFSAVLYLHSTEKQTLQRAIQVLVAPSESTLETGRIISNNIRAAAIVVALVPMLAIYPFIQRFFIKGIFLGAIKE